jgi:hypothetical protein
VWEQRFVRSKELVHTTQGVRIAQCHELSGRWGKDGLLGAHTTQKTFPSLFSFIGKTL